MRSPRYIYDDLVHLSNYDEYSFAISQGLKGKPISDQYAIFPDSGYFIMRSNPTYLPFDKSIHIVFKCGFLSHYHRHDDDNNVLIFGYGEEWLTEGGLYQHSATDPQRIHMRSHYAHNFMAPTGVDAKRDRDKYPTSGIIDFLIDPPFARAKGETMMFPGFVYSREISYIGRNMIYIKDVLKKIENTNIRTCDQYWHIPQDKKIEILNNEFYVKSKNFPCMLRVSIESTQLMSVEELEPNQNPYFCWRSTQYDVLEPIRVLKVRYAFEDVIVVSAIKLELFFNS